jgi:hypothetical protein
MSQAQDPSPLAPAAPPFEGAADHPHNFDIQKELHQRIRNDPDYDDWEYGTEPLPHEAWIAARERERSASAEPGAAGPGVEAIELPHQQQTQ